METHWTKHYAIAFTICALIGVAMALFIGDKPAQYLCLYLAIPGSLMMLVEGAEWLMRKRHERREMMH